MRQIILDTETTGLRHTDGNRIIEIGCIEVIDRHPTGRTYHQYINADRDSEDGALEVHGITTEFLSDKPRFAEIAQEFCDFVKDAELIIHNAPFDVGFINAEFERLSIPKIQDQVALISDSLLLARSMFPGRRNTLDALCERLGISSAHRVLHGALLDASLLAEVYLAMTRGQNSFDMEINPHQNNAANSQLDLKTLAAGIRVQKASDEENAIHETVLDEIDKQSKSNTVWRRENA